MLLSEEDRRQTGEGQDWRRLVGKKEERMEDKSIREGPCSCRADKLSKGQQAKIYGVGSGRTETTDWSMR